MRVKQAAIRGPVGVNEPPLPSAATRDHTPELLDTPQTAELLRVPQGTLRYWRHRGIGPRGFRMGPKRVMYRKSDVLAWIDAQYRTTILGEQVET